MYSILSQYQAILDIATSLSLNKLLGSFARRNLAVTLTQAAHPQTYGFIDSLALHGAFAALRGRDPRSWTEWETQNLLECTYLLLFRQMGLVPGPQARGTAAPGDESILVSRLPSLFALPDLNMTNANAQARSSVDAWCRLHATTLAAAWGKLTSRPDFDHWGQRMSDFFWEVHVKHHDGLFDPGHITLMQPLIGISEADLRDLHARSRDQATVKQWLAAPDSEPAVVGRSGYLISTLIRGKFHEFLAKHARALGPASYAPVCLGSYIPRGRDSNLGI